MPREAYIAIAIAIVVALVAIFVISFVVYVKTPAPKGCEKKRGPNCENCEQASCRFYSYAEEREEAKKKAAETNRKDQQ
ncbi:MAG: hypothetical protein MJ239_01600 [Bacilli bacterium]|nr:hypothetical protein [Bacilli bacterium]